MPGTDEAARGTTVICTSTASRWARKSLPEPMRPATPPPTAITAWTRTLRSWPETGRLRLTHPQRPARPPRLRQPRPLILPFLERSACTYRAITMPGTRSFQVFVDGHQVGGTQSVTAVHANGQWQDISISGDFDPVPRTTWTCGSSMMPGMDEAEKGTTAICTLAASRWVRTSSPGLRRPAIQAHLLMGIFDPHAAVMVGNGTASFELHGSDWFLI